MKRIKSKIKNFILKTITTVAGCTFLFMACALDSPSWIPFILCVVSAVWLVLFSYANGYIDERIEWHG